MLPHAHNMTPPVLEMWGGFFEPTPGPVGFFEPPATGHGLRWMVGANTSRSSRELPKARPERGGMPLRCCEGDAGRATKLSLEMGILPQKHMIDPENNAPE